MTEKRNGKNVILIDLVFQLSSRFRSKIFFLISTGEGAGARATVPVEGANPRGQDPIYYATDDIANLSRGQRELENAGEIGGENKLINQTKNFKKSESIM